MRKLKINRLIYSDDTINRTIQAYRTHALTTVLYKKQYATVIFWSCKYDECETIKEFENYMIGVENS